MENFASYRSRVISLILISLLTLIGVSGLLVRNSFFATPIYASDEYAYLASGKFYEHRAEMYAADPGLQRVSNLLYFRIVQQAFAITRDGSALLKLLNVLLYTLVGLAFTAATLYLAGNGAARVFPAFYFLLPWSGYLVSIQPETVAYFSIICVGATAVAAVHFRSRLLCGVAGMLTAAACYIKPNAIGVAVGTAIFLLLSFPRNPSGREHAFVRAEVFVLYLATLYVGLIGCPWILGEHWSWMPAFASGHYATELKAQSPGILRLAGWCLACIGGHLAVLSLLFPVGICGVVAAWKKKTIPAALSDNRSHLAASLARWLTWSGGVSIVFVAYYSVKIDQEAGFATARLHGRYLGFIFPFLLLFTLLPLFSPALWTEASRRIRSHPLVLASVLLLSAVVAWGVCGRHFFNIYPWDYPELTVLYSKDNSYWHEPALWSIRLIFLPAAGVTAACLALPKAWARYAAIVYLALSIVVANRQNTAFQRVTSQTLGGLTTEARTLSAIADLGHRSGIVVGSQRHGGLSYVLFGLSARARVVVQAEQSTISDGDLPPGCEWVLWYGNFNPRFSYQSLLQTERLSLFLLRADKGSPLTRDVHLVAQPIRLDMSRRDASSFGFNSPEQWGSWSCLAEPFIQLPAEVRGALRITLRVWTGAENAGQPLQLTIGGETHSIALTAAPADYSLDFSNVELSNHLNFSFPVIQKHEWDRPLGFALAAVSVTPVNTPNQGPETSPP
jgi:hypothetical protein